MIDFEHAFHLLHVADMARQWPELRWLHDAAMKELQKANATTPAEAPTPAAPAPARRRFGAEDA